LDFENFNFVSQKIISDQSWRVQTQACKVKAA